MNDYLQPQRGNCISVMSMQVSIYMGKKHLEPNTIPTSPTGATTLTRSALYPVGKVLLWGKDISVPSR